jgi:thiamine biosynthesis lipoprotein ApbE
VSADLRDRPLGPVYEARFEVLGRAVHVLVVRGTGEQVELASATVRDLVERWLGAAGDLARLRPGVGPVPVDAETVALLGLARLGREATEGGYQPWGPHADALTLDAVAGTASLAADGWLRLGGVEGGLAADIAVRDVLDAGAGGCCVNVGGVVRAEGIPPRGQGWTVSVPGPGADAAAVTYLLGQGGLAVQVSGGGQRVVTADSAWHAAAIAAERTPREAGAAPLE